MRSVDSILALRTITIKTNIKCLVKINMENTEGLRQIDPTEKIGVDDICLVGGELTDIPPSMIGKTIYQASLEYFGENTSQLLTVFRIDDDITICDPSKIKVHIMWSKPHETSN